MLRKHTVLRDATMASTTEPFQPGGPSRARAGRPEAALVPPEPRLETEDLTPSRLRELARDPEVVGIAPVMPTRLIKPVDVAGALAGSAWGVAAVRADVSAFDGSGTTVAVLDTGIDAAHPAFAGLTLVEQDFSGAGNGDVNGHGTHCAGTIFGRDVAGARIGVAPGVTRALIGKVLGNDGRGDSDMTFRAIQWAVDNGADVVSMSLGFDFPGLVAELVQQGWPVALATSAALEAYRGNLRMFDALMGMIRARAAFGQSTVVVAAAGNESERDTNPEFEIAASLPAAAEGVISVAALQQSPAGLSIASFSNTLAQISGPGVGIQSAKVGGGLRALSGTSMACPHVAGVAALWWQQVRSLPLPATAATVTARLMATARLDTLAPGIDVADRGVGLATAP
jgi:subtilisin family serine protease